jgi:hypothetical protein
MGVFPAWKGVSGRNCPYQLIPDSVELTVHIRNICARAATVGAQNCIKGIVHQADPALTLTGAI